MGTPAWLLAVGLPAKGAPRRPAERAEIQIEPGIDFEATHILYHVTVRNRGGRAVRDVVITPVVAPGPFVLDEPPKKVPVLGPREYGTASFRIRARGPPEELEVAAKIAYPDPGTGEVREATTSPVRVVVMFAREFEAMERELPEVAERIRQAMLERQREHQDKTGEEL